MKYITYVDYSNCQAAARTRHNKNTNKKVLGYRTNGKREHIKLYNYQKKILYETIDLQNINMSYKLLEKKLKAAEKIRHNIKGLEIFSAQEFGLKF